MIAVPHISIRDAWRDDFRPRDLRPIYERTRVNLQGTVFTKSGPFEIGGSRHFIRPLDALVDPHVREVNILAPVQDGKTLIADIWLPDIILNDPGPFLGLFQKDDVAQDHCKLRTWPVLKHVPDIKAILDTLGKTESCTQEILLPQMPIYINGPALGNLQSKPFRYLWCDEPWMYKKGVIGEAKGRLGSFVKLGLDKALFTSQGGFAQNISETETKEWYEQYISGELNEWHVQCAGCREFFVPVWGCTREVYVKRFPHLAGVVRSGASMRANVGMLWDDRRDQQGLWRIEECKSTLRYCCPLCDHETKALRLIPDETTFDQLYKATQSAWNRTGEYRVIGERKSIKKSFHWNGIITYPWEYLLDLFLSADNAAAMGDRSHLIIFWQKRMAEFHDQTKCEDTVRLEAVEIETGALDRAIIEVDGIQFKHRQGQVDVQMTHLWLAASIWSDTGDDLTIWYEKLMDWSEVENRQKLFKIADQDMAIDINYQLRAQEVARECVLHGHEGKDAKGNIRWFQWQAYRGTDRDYFDHPGPMANGKPTKVQRPYSFEPERIPITDVTDPRIVKLFSDFRKRGWAKPLCMVWKWSNPTIKEMIERRRDGLARGILSKPVEGEWVTEWSKQMHGEKKIPITNKRGYTSLQYHAIRDNHAFDCKGMDIAHAIRRGRLSLPAIASDGKPPEK